MNFTNIEQSKKLLELGLSPDSADMFYQHIPELNSWDSVPEVAKYIKESIAIPCWSVGALMNLMPNQTIEKIDDVYYVHYEPYYMYSAPVLVDAIYGMVVYLLENNKI